MANPVTRPIPAETADTPASLLTQWRSDDVLDEVKCEALRASLSKVHLLLFPRWSDAARGDAGAAIGIGIYVAADPSSPLWLVDHVGSALRMCAVEGSDDAVRVLRRLRRSHAHRHEAGPEA
jgi:hypothetical protein